MKKFLLLLIAVILSLCLSGCSIDISSVEGLMRPPRLSGENSLLQNAFEKALNANNSVIMKTPVSGENRSSYLYFDLDKDGSNEALVFYSDPAIDEFACAGIFKFIDSDWKLVSSIKGSGEEIFDVTFADVNGDNSYEIIICWTYIKSSETDKNLSFTDVSDRIMSVYSYNGNALTPVISHSFLKMFVSDLNGDGSEEVVLISNDLSNKDKRTTCKILGFDKNFAVIRDRSFRLTGMIDIFNIIKDIAVVDGEKHTRIFVDGGISETAVITEVIDVTFSNFEVSLPLYDSNISENPHTIRNVRTYCTDIDGDGEIEIPTLETLPYSTVINNDNNSNGLNLTVWSKLNNGELQMQMKCLLNASNGYMFIFPEEWSGKITAVYDSSNGALSFYSIDENSTPENEIFSLCAFSEIKWKENNYGYIKLASSGDMIFGYTVSGDFKGFNTDVITDNFIILN